MKWVKVIKWLPEPIDISLLLATANVTFKFIYLDGKEPEVIYCLQERNLLLQYWMCVFNCKEEECEKEVELQRKPRKKWIAHRGNKGFCAKLYRKLREDEPLLHCSFPITFCTTFFGFTIHFDRKHGDTQKHFSERSLDIDPALFCHRWELHIVAICFPTNS